MRSIIARLFLIFGILIILDLNSALTDDEAEALHRNITDTCIHASSLSPDEIKRINENHIISEDQPMATKNLQCYLLCYYKSVGLIENNGKWKTALLLEYLGHMFDDQCKAKKAVDRCVNIKGSNPCEQIYNFQKCVYE